MARNFPAITFERYVDDSVVQCAGERQARFVLTAIEKRMGEVGLQLHPSRRLEAISPPARPPVQGTARDAGDYGPDS